MINVTVNLLLVHLPISFLNIFWLKFKSAIVPVSGCRFDFVQSRFLSLVTLYLRNLIVQSIDFGPVLKTVFLHLKLRVNLLVNSVLFLFSTDFKSLLEV